MEHNARIIDEIQRAANFEWVDVEKQIKYRHRDSHRWNWRVNPYDRTTPYPPEVSAHE
ncbi:hypothetical protein D3C72_2398470 [compost metagenome]